MKQESTAQQRVVQMIGIVGDRHMLTEIGPGVETIPMLKVQGLWSFYVDVGLPRYGLLSHWAQRVVSKEKEQSE